MVHAYTRCIIPIVNVGVDAQDQKMSQNISGHGSKSQIEEAKELNSVVFLNMATCYYLLKNY